MGLVSDGEKNKSIVKEKIGFFRFRVWLLGKRERKWCAQVTKLLMSLGHFPEEFRPDKAVTSSVRMPLQWIIARTHWLTNEAEHGPNAYLNRVRSEWRQGDIPQIALPASVQPNEIAQALPAYFAYRHGTNTGQEHTHWFEWVESVLRELSMAIIEHQHKHIWSVALKYAIYQCDVACAFIVIMERLEWISRHESPELLRTMLMKAWVNHPLCIEESAQHESWRQAA